MRFVWLLLIALAGALTGYLFTRFEGSAPRIDTLTAEVAIGSGEYAHEVRVTDEGTGVESIRVWLRAAGKDHELVAETFPGSLFAGASLKIPRKVTATVHPEELGLTDGPATLHIEARDFSWRGNVSTAEVPLTIDTHPPRIELATGLTYVRRGGAELVVYRIPETPAREGVAVGDSFFPGYAHPQDPTWRVALYAVSPDTPPGTPIRLVAEDRAGNRAEVPLAVELIERNFPTDEIRLSDGFMQRKAAELGVAVDGSVLDAYLKINRDMRVENARMIAEICRSSSPDRLWSGPFAQLPSSQVGARFAERRTYVHDGQIVDRQVHMGFDLASTARATVPAANDGVVTFTGPLGIYGETVILDHGLGLFSLYAHLSEISVEKGQAVHKGDPLGRTGTTGLAGGDHLHFAMLASGVFIDPLEWFDERWIEEHIETKLQLSE